MLSKIIREKIDEKFQVRYAKDCETLAQLISSTCQTSISASTLLRLYGFVKGREPRAYTLDTIAAFIGYPSYEQLLSSFDKERESSEKIIEKISARQVKSGEKIQITYEPGKLIEILKDGAAFKVSASTEKKIFVYDEVRFSTSIEVHYPLTFTEVVRQGRNLGRIQIATVSGITSIAKV
jgi:hypothetical protein